MITTTLFSLCGTLVLYTVMGQLSGFTIAMTSKLLPLVMIVSTVPVLYAANYLQDLRLCFTSKKTFAAVPLVRLQNAAEAISLFIKTGQLLALFICSATSIMLVSNWQRLDFAGPNLGTLIETALNALVLTLICIPIKLKLRCAAITYMTDETDTADEESDAAPARTANNKGTGIWKLFAVIVWIGICGAIVIKRFTKNEASLGLPFDIPALLILLFFTLLALAASGSFKTFGKAFVAAYSKAAITTAERALYTETLSAIMSTVLCTGLAAAFLGGMGTLSNLADTEKLAPNYYAALLPVLYAAAICFVLLVTKASLARRSEQN